MGKGGDDWGRTLLVLGGARSGKSRRAQALAEAAAAAPVFIATAQAFDAEMADRIVRHRADRDARWRTVEAPLDLPAAITREDGGVVLVDCLTLWLSNLLLAKADLPTATDALAAAIGASRARLILVSNEVGWGIVPHNALARRFRDAAGLLHQRLAAICDTAELVVAGLPWRLKG